MGLSGRVPHRVAAATKSELLGLLDEALESGWTWRAACRGLDLPERRANRWRRRREAGRLADANPGGDPVHGILAEEADAILAVFGEWAQVDRSHRKLRGLFMGQLLVGTGASTELAARLPTSASHENPTARAVSSSSMS